MIFDIKTAKFIDDINSSASFLDTRAPNTILSGYGPPNNSQGKTGDFYIDLDTYEIYHCDDTWGEPTDLKGKPGEFIRGKDGKDGIGINGKDGVGIASVTQTDNGFLITLTTGEETRFQIPKPINGKDGRGVADIKQLDLTKLVIELTDGTEKIFTIPSPKNGREVELGRSQTHVQWRYKGDNAWYDLFAIPKRAAHGGGGIHSIREASDVSFANVEDGYALVWNAAQKKLVFAPAVGLERFSNLSASATILQADTNTIFTNNGATALVVASLPAAALGLKYTFLITDVDGFQLQANGSDTVRVSGSVSSAGGTLTCTQVGGAITIYGQSGGWFAASSQRTWVDA